MTKDRILSTILDGKNHPVTGFPSVLEKVPHVGWLYEDLSIGDSLTLVYNNGDPQHATLESMEASAQENPLTGMLEVTVKLQLKKEEQ